MGKNDRDEVARRELAHALEALGDGIGHDAWGPGPVINRLSKRVLKEPAVVLAVEALEAATMANHDLLHRVNKDDALVGIRRLAPVFLELIIEKDEERQAKASVKAGLCRAFMDAPVVVVPPQYDESLAEDSRLNELLQAAQKANDMMFGNIIVSQEPRSAWEKLQQMAKIPSAVQKADEAYRAKLLADTHPLSAAPLVRPIYTCAVCGVRDGDCVLVAMRADGEPRCNDCHNAKANGCTCPICAGAQARRGM